MVCNEQLLHPSVVLERHAPSKSTTAIGVSTAPAFPMALSTIAAPPRTATASQSPPSGTAGKRLHPPGARGGVDGLSSPESPDRKQHRSRLSPDTTAVAQSPPPLLDGFLLAALNNPCDKAFILQLDQEMAAFIHDTSGRTRLAFPPMNSYQRLVVHRVAAFFGLDHVVSSTADRQRARTASLSEADLCHGGSVAAYPRSRSAQNVVLYKSRKSRMYRAAATSLWIVNVPDLRISDLAEVDDEQEEEKTSQNAMLYQRPRTHSAPLATLTPPEDSAQGSPSPTTTTTITDPVLPTMVPQMFPQYYIYPAPYGMVPADPYLAVLPESPTTHFPCVYQIPTPYGYQYSPAPYVLIPSSAYTAAAAAAASQPVWSSTLSPTQTIFHYAMQPSYQGVRPENANDPVAPRHILQVTGYEQLLLDYMAATGGTRKRAAALEELAQLVPYMLTAHGGGLAHDALADVKPRLVHTRTWSGGWIGATPRREQQQPHGGAMAEYALLLVFPNSRKSKVVLEQWQRAASGNAQRDIVFVDHHDELPAEHYAGSTSRNPFRVTSAGQVYAYDPCALDNDDDGSAVLPFDLQIWHVNVVPGNKSINALPRRPKLPATMSFAA
ncbi:hypothetical protein RI367_006938 [Sorochytrium milnesiophthora]